MPKKLKEKGFSFDYYTKQMLAESSAFHHRLKPPIFSKKPLLQISGLKKYHDNSLDLLTQNKLSDKLSRRDIQFYDLYKVDKLGKSEDAISLH